MGESRLTPRFVVVQGSAAGSEEKKKAMPMKALYLLWNCGSEVPHPVTSDLSAERTTRPLQTMYQPAVAPVHSSPSREATPARSVALTRGLSSPRRSTAVATLLDSAVGMGAPSICLP